MLEKPKSRVESLTDKEISDDLLAFAAKHGIDLSTADITKTKLILKDASSLSSEVAKMREGND